MNYGTITYTRDSNGTLSTAFQVRLGYQIISEDIATNTREIKLQLESRSINGNYTTYGFNQTTTIDGVTAGTTVMDYRNTNVWQIFGTRTIEIVGAFDGSKNASFISTATGTGRPYKGNASVNISLEPLHQPPSVGYSTIDEKNDVLINAGIDGETFVAKLSKKQFNLVAYTYDDANITEYRVQNGNRIYTSPTTPITINFAENDIYYNVVNNEQYIVEFMIGATDDQGGKNDTWLSGKNFIPYTTPNLINTASSIKRNGQTSGKVILNLIGTFYNKQIGNLQNNISISFKYWKTSESEPEEYITIPSDAYNISDNNITITNWAMSKNNVEIDDIDKNYPYKFKIKCVDSFNSTSEITLSVPVGEYLWCEFKDKVDFKKITIQGEEIKPQNNTTKVIQRFIDGDKTYLTGYYITFGVEDIDTTDGGVVFNNDGTITINHIGLVKISANLWVRGSATTSRPWIVIQDYTNQKIITEIIDDTSSSYTSFVFPDIYINNEEAGNQYAFYVQSVTGSLTINGGSGRTPSYCNIQLL